MIYDMNGTENQNPYDVEGTILQSAYDVEGNEVWSAIHPIPLDYSSYTTTDLFTYVADGFNGFDVHNGVIAQLMNGNKLYLFDLSDHSTIATALSITSAHGDSANFSKEKLYTTDEFPFLYATSDSNPANVYVNRITRTGTALIRTLSFPLDKTGYYAAHAYDLDNNVMYMIGYSEQNYTSDDDGNNKTVVSKWDMSNLADNGNNNFTPTFVSSFELPFIYVMQGLQFFDGYIWISSGYNNNTSQHIYALNPSTHEVDYTITLDDNIEIEGLAWVYDETANKYWMLIGQQNGSAGINYSRIDFAELT